MVTATRAAVHADTHWRCRWGVRCGGRRRAHRARRGRVLQDPFGPGAGHRPSEHGGAVLMETKVDEIADGIYRLSTLVPDAAPGGFSFNQFVVDADEPLLFHCGPRQMFPLVSEAASRVVPLERFRWITFGHVESDECGSMNDWLAAAPNAEVAPTIRKLAELQPSTLAIMHGSSFSGDGAGSLNALADAYAKRLAAAEV